MNLVLKRGCQGYHEIHSFSITQLRESFGYLSRITAKIFAHIEQNFLLEYCSLCYSLPASQRSLGNY